MSSEMILSPSQPPLRFRPHHGRLPPVRTHLHPTTATTLMINQSRRSCRSTRCRQGPSVLLQQLLLLLVVPLLITRLLGVDGYASPPPQLPVVGILSQPSKKHDHSYHYIATSYVDWIEGGSFSSDNSKSEATNQPQPQAITLPIPYDAPPELLDELLTQINGLLLPGGWNGYMPPSVPYLLDRIVESNENGIYFPVWGTCLGYEFLIKYIGGVDAIQTGFDLYNTSIPLEAVRIQELYDNRTIYETVTNLPVTLNNHQLGIEPEHFLSNPKLTAVWNITSINYDANDRPFVSSIEPIHPMEFPFYGVQYHPEKNAYEYTTYPNTTVPYENIDHTEEGIEFSHYLSNFFIEKVRYGMQQQQQQKQQRHQMNRFPPIRSYTSSTGIKFEDIYIIPFASHWMTTLSQSSDHQYPNNNNNNNSNSNNNNNNNHTTTTTRQAIINVSKTGIIDLDTATNPDRDEPLRLLPYDDMDDRAASRRHLLLASTESSATSASWNGAV